jgi:hypothetical protein
MFDAVTERASAFRRKMMLKNAPYSFEAKKLSLQPVPSGRAIVIGTRGILAQRKLVPPEALDLIEPGLQMPGGDTSADTFKNQF